MWRRIFPRAFRGQSAVLLLIQLMCAIAIPLTTPNFLLAANTATQKEARYRLEITEATLSNGVVEIWIQTSSNPEAWFRTSALALPSLFFKSPSCVTERVSLSLALALFVVFFFYLCRFICVTLLNCAPYKLLHFRLATKFRVATLKSKLSELTTFLASGDDVFFVAN